jgi:hypothetical protein
MSTFLPEFEEVAYTPPSIESFAVGAAGGRKHKGNGQAGPVVEQKQQQEDFDLGEWDFGLDNEPIPPRGWLLGNLLCRQFLTAIFADGGVGKTALMMVWALCLATGKKLLGEHVFERCAVVIVCFEDGKDELRRRLTAAMLHHRISKADIEGYLFITAVSRADAKLAANRNGEIMAGKLGGALERAIIRRNAGAAFLDPFVKTHLVGENDNAAIDFVTEILADISIRHDCAFGTPHHTRKGPPDPGNADSGRGAGSMKDAFRLCYTLNPMAKEEADTLGVSGEARASLVRLDSGKVNLVPRAAAARWFKLVGVPINNGTDLHPRGDEIQTVECWIPPDTFAQLTTITINAILDRIEAGPYPGGRYSSAPNAKDRAIWLLIQEHCPNFTDKQAKEVANTWIKNGVLEKRQHKDPKDSHDHPSLFVAKRPGDTWDV